MSDYTIKPFLKWAGGKTSLIPFLKNEFYKDSPFLQRPPIKGRFIEPFVGSGVVFMNVEAGNYIINDINPDLYLIYNLLKINSKKFIDKCESLFTDENNSREKYNELREEFNNLDPLEKERRGVLFIYLNRHCFNGLCRYNKNGGFNVPFGNYEKPKFPRRAMEIASNKLKNVIISNRSFEEILEIADENDIVYNDPPYVPLSDTSSFTDYASTGFNQDQQILLAKLAEKSKAKVFISNHDTEFTRDIYKNATEIKELEVTRTISAEPTSRKKVKELLAIYKN